MKRRCLKDCRIDGIPLVRGEEYEIQWDEFMKCMILYTVWGFTTLTDREYITLFV